MLIFPGASRELLRSHGKQDGDRRKATSRKNSRDFYEGDQMDGMPTQCIGPAWPATRNSGSHLTSGPEQRVQPEQWSETMGSMWELRFHIYKYWL